MKTFNYSLLIILLFTFVACEEDVIDFKLNLPELEHVSANIGCAISSEGVVIDSDSAYQTFQEEYEFYCLNEFPVIDFSQNTLLGKRRSTGCDIKTAYSNVYIDEIAKKYVFQTILEGEGNCLSLLEVPF